MNTVKRPKIYPKEWSGNIVYMKSPKSNIVHLCWRTYEIEPMMRTAQPFCKVICWKNVVPVLSDEIAPGDRLCKMCAEHLEDINDYAVTRPEFIELVQCKPRRKIK